MKNKPIRIRQWIFYLVYYLIFIAVVARMLPYFVGTQWQNIVIVLFVSYFTLLSSERLIINKVKWFFYLYAFLQVGLVAALMFVPTDTAPQDYFFTLIVPLCGQAIWDMNPNTGRFFVAGFSLFCFVSLIITYPSSEGIAFGLTYIAGCILVAVLSTATLNSIIAQEETQTVLSELRSANQKLVEYSQKVENLAAAEERNRLARELHDSVSQTIFSMTLTAEAAKMLLNNENPRIQTLLDHLQTLSQNALVEMRSLIQKLRPHSIVENGLEAALRQHIAERQAQDELIVDLQIVGDFQLPANSAEMLFRIVQEALNNVVKHSNSKSAAVKITAKNAMLSLLVSDEGVGFDTTASRFLAGHVGLQSMKERVNSLGGKFTIDSKPGKGTRIQVDNIPLIIGSNKSESSNDRISTDIKED